jgi:hypothetical protein
MGAFDLSNPGRPPVLLSTTRAGKATRKEPHRAIIFIAYGAALAAALALIGAAALRSRRPRERDHATRVL